MERGFASINIALADVAEDLNFYADAIITEVDKIENDVLLIAENIEQMQRSTEESTRLIQEILDGLSRVQDSLDKAATTEQMQEVLTSVEEFGEGVRVLWNLADFDVDGVVNGLDQCPETPLRAEVDWRGCAADQTPITATTTSTI